MNESYDVSKPQSIGYLIVKVSTARGSIPLSDAAVSVRGGTYENSTVIYSMSTNSDGETPKISLPTPNISLSKTPESSVPYALYNIDVFKEGYSPSYFHNVPVFPSITSVQPAVMLPLSEGGKPATSENIHREQKANNE